MKTQDIKKREEWGGTVKDRWEKLDSNRKTVLDRARQCAELTIPSLMPPEGSDENVKLKTPYQGLGARAVNNLASKLLLALLPPNAPFFRLSIDDYTLEELTQQEGMRAKVEKELSKIERAIMTWIETKALRVPTFTALKLLIVTGNALQYLPDKGGMKVYRLDQYCVKRDPMGNVLEIVIKEQVHPAALPDEIREDVKGQLDNPDKPTDLFTHILLHDGKWNVRQEVQGITVPGSEGTYPKDESPWIPLRWTAVVGEDYGRGPVEEYQGDLLTLEALSKAMVEAAVVASKIVFLVAPNGSTSVAKLAKAKNGDYIPGIEQDVSKLQVDKYYDFRVTAETMQRIEQRLSYAFLLMTSIQRDAERVTAEEIREMANELEEALGGVYSVLSQEMQLPLVRRLMVQMNNANKLPKLPKEDIQPLITTGVEALGRGNDLNKLQAFAGVMSQFQQEGLSRINISDFGQRVATSLGIDAEGLLIPEEVLQIQQQQAQLAAMTQGVAPGVAQELTKGMVAGGQTSQQRYR